MPDSSLKQLFLNHDLGDAFDHVCISSPYTKSILEKYSPEVSEMLESNNWLSELDYSQYDHHGSNLQKLLFKCKSDLDCKQIVRRFRNLHSARILWHDLNGLADWRSIFKAQSDLADLCNIAVLNYLEKEFSDKYHKPTYQDGRHMQLAIIAMGKWGGEELNFSSDIDFILVYAESGEVEGKDGRRSIENHQYFTKISQRLIQILDDVTADGFVYRCDTRLRPFGESGALVVSLAALEQYLTRHGREWERYAYLKARCVTGDESIVQGFEDLRRPFVYRRYLDYGVFSKLREMHAQIADQVKKKDIKENLKLGRGGIRECEFLVQAMQLLRGGRDRSLQQRNFYSAYKALLDSNVLQDPEQRLFEAYIFLRLLENRLQGLHQEQTHMLPTDESDRRHLLVAMNISSWSDLISQLNIHRKHVQLLFDDQMSLLSFNDPEAETHELSWIELVLDTSLFTDEMRTKFCNVEKSRFYKNFSESSQETLDSLLRNFLLDLVQRDSEQTLDSISIENAANNFLDIIHAIGKRTVYFSLLVERPAALKHLVDVCFTSEFLCKQIAQWPILLDEMLDARIFTQAPTRFDIETATDALVDNINPDDTERMINDLVVHKHVQSFRIATAEIFKHLPLMKVSDRLSDLAELILEVVFKQVLIQVLEKFDLPGLLADQTGFSILAYGKLGGLELSYNSDLDLVFLFNAEELPATHPLSNDQSLQTNFYSRLVQQCLRYLDMPTSMGRLYEIDTRLRPSGNSGFLISSLSAFETYQQEEAWVWEHQALARTRTVYGSELSRNKITDIRKRVLTRSVKHENLKKEVISMRERMRKQFEKEHNAEGRFHLKHSHGGMIDLEFLVQYLVLENTAEFHSLIEFSDNIRQLEALASVGIISDKSSKELIAAYISLREKSHLLTLQSKQPFISPESVSPEREIVIKHWKMVFA